MPPDRMIGGILFLPCLFVCLFVFLSVCLSVVNFNLRYNFCTVRDILHIWHANSTNDTLSNDAKVNDLVTLTLKLEIAFWTLLPPGASVFHKYTLIFIYLLSSWNGLNYYIYIYAHNCTSVFIYLKIHSLKLT